MQLPAWNENEKKKRKKPSQLVMNTSKDASPTHCRKFSLSQTSDTQCAGFQHAQIEENLNQGY